MTTPRTHRTRLALSGALVLTTISLFGMGASATFTSSAATSENITSGTLELALGDAGTAANRLTIDATNVAAGDEIQRVVALSNAGSLDHSTISLTTAASVSSLLDTDTVNGLQMVVDSCDVPWTESGTAPACTYTCAGTPTTLLSSQPVIGSDMDLAGTEALTAGATSHLRVVLTLPATADNTFQGLSSTIDYSFAGIQRTATNR